MTKLVFKLLAASLCVLASGASYGLASICSGEFLPLAGKNTLKHEVVWSYHDNWFSDMYAEVYTEVAGVKTAKRSDEYLMGNGGSTLQYAS